MATTPSTMTTQEMLGRDEMKLAKLAASLDHVKINLGIQAENTRKLSVRDHTLRSASLHLDIVLRGPSGLLEEMKVKVQSLDGQDEDSRAAYTAVGARILQHYVNAEANSAQIQQVTQRQHANKERVVALKNKRVRLINAVNKIAAEWMEKAEESSDSSIQDARKTIEEVSKNILAENKE